MVGLYADRSDVIRAFLRSRDGRYTVIDPPDSFPNEELADINNRGEIVGFADEDGDNTAGTRGFLRTRRGRYEAIEVPDAASTVAFKVNDRSQVAGVWFARSLPGAAPQVHGFVWDGGEVTTIDDGFHRNRNGRFTMIEAPDEATYTRALDINNQGDIVGDYDAEPPGTDNGDPR